MIDFESNFEDHDNEHSRTVEDDKNFKILWRTYNEQLTFDFWSVNLFKKHVFSVC